MEGLVPQRWQSVRRLPRPGGLEPFERWIIPEMSDLRQRPFLTRRGVGKRKYRILHPRARRQGEQADVNKRAREPTAPFGSMLGSCQAGTEPFGTAQLFRPYTASCWYHPRRPVSGRSTIRSSSHDSKLLLLPHGYCQGGHVPGRQRCDIKQWASLLARLHAHYLRPALREHIATWSISKRA